MTHDKDTPRMVLLISGDLFFASRIRATVEEVGGELQVLPAAEAAAAETEGEGETDAEGKTEGEAAAKRGTWVETHRPAVVLVDLETPRLNIGAVVKHVKSRSGAAVVAYGPHVHQQRLQAAREAGCDEVLTRGHFDAARADLLRRLLAQ